MSKLLRDTTLYESKVVKTNDKFIVAGVFQKCDTRNANGRVYKRRLWEKILALPEIKQQLKDRTMLGELGHPDIVETTLTNVSHIVTKLDLLANGDVYGEAEILDTPSGKILKTLYEAGVKIGISSRGYIPEGSSLIPEGDDLVVPDDFQLVGFDFVLTPSTPGAHPTLKESKKQELKAILEESKGKLDAKLYTMLESMGQPLVESTPKKAESKKESNKIIIGFGDIESEQLSAIAEDINKRFSVDFKENEEFNSLEMSTNISESELNIVSAKVNRYLGRVYPNKCQYIKAMVEGKQVNLSDSLFRKANFTNNTKEGENVDTENTNNAYIEKLESIVAELRDRYLVSEEVIELLQSQNNTAVDVIDDIKTRYLTAEAVINQFKEYTSTLEETTQEVVEMYKTAEEVISELTRRYTLSEKVIADLRDRYLTAEEVVKESIKRYEVAEQVIEELKDRYLRAESVIEELAQRYTLSESVISELRAALDAKEPVKKESESTPAKVDESVKITETPKEEKVDEAFISAKADEYGISIKEAYRIFKKAKNDKDTFELILSEKSSAIKNKYEEFPFINKGKKVDEGAENSSPKMEDKLAHIISRVL